VALMAILAPLVGAIVTYTRVLMQLEHCLTREEAAATYLTRQAEDSIISQRNVQIEALNANIVAIAANQDALNGNINRIMGKLGIDGSLPMRPIPNATLPLARNPEPATSRSDRR